MCNIGIVTGDARVKLPTAILFMNSNKSERNIRKKVAKSAYISNEKSVDFIKSLAYNDIKAESLLRNLRSVMHNTKGGMPT